MQKSQAVLSKQNALCFGDLGAKDLNLWFGEEAWQAGLSRIALEGAKINSKPDGRFYVVH